MFEEITIIIIILTFIKGIYEYVKSIRWKKSEFLSKEIKEFFSDSDITKVTMVLDWNIRLIEIDGKITRIDDQFLISALQPHTVKDKFTKEEAIIRDLFDKFFDKLSYFNIYIKNGLVNKEEVKIYLSYYLNILTKPGRKPTELVDVFNTYLSVYNYKEVIELINLTR